MSFEDDMIEYGFTDENEFLEYLLDEAEESMNKQDDWRDDCIDYSADYEEERVRVREKWREKLQKQREKDLIFRYWAIDNPFEAELWNIYNCKRRRYLQDCEGYNYDEYNLWINWLGERLEYENFKEKSPNRWKKLVFEINREYIRSAIEDKIGFVGLKFYDISGKSSVPCIRKTSNDIYEIFKIWKLENQHLWRSIVRRYKRKLKSNEGYLLQAWSELFYWNDRFALWKYKYPKVWKEKKGKNYYVPIHEWKNENLNVWNEWKLKHKALYEKSYLLYEQLMWYIYVDYQWNGYSSLVNETLFLGFEQFLFPYLKEYGITITSEKENEGYEQLVSILILKYKEDKEKHSFMMDKCSVSGMHDFYFPKTSQLMDSMLFDLGEIPDIETPDEYANRKVSELWIKKHKRIWNKWRDKYLWNHYIADEVKYLSFCDVDYYKLWKLRNREKWSLWIEKEFLLWKSIAQEIDIFFLWVLDGNEVRFSQWALVNIPGWKEAIDEAKDFDLRQAVFEMSFTRDFKEDFIKRWESVIEEQIIKNVWKVSKKKSSCNPRYIKAAKKMIEARYSQKVKDQLQIERDLTYQTPFPPFPDSNSDLLSSVSPDEFPF